MTRPVILDCDPGLDDAVAIMLALASPEEVELRGITAVCGNVALVHTVRNAGAVCTLAGHPQMPVFAGCSRAIMSEGARAEEVHGSDGVGGVTLPEPAQNPQPRHAVDFIVDSCLAAPEGGMTLCPVGPMTNIAMALVKEPAIRSHIREIVFMGGVAFEAGNVTPHAEFNIFADPHAAEIVLSAGLPCVMMGLDVTRQAEITADRIEAMRAIGTPLSEAVVTMLGFYGDSIGRLTERKSGRKSKAVLHDPCAIAYLIDPDLFSGAGHQLRVATHGEQAGAMEVLQPDTEAGRSPVTVMTDLDADGFFALLVDRLRQL